ncbi:MAG: Phenylacetic acid catabolic protein [candidate division NC10 bacterium]
MQTDKETHERLLERIRAGEITEGPEEMSEEYRTHLVNLMQMQADSELSGGFGYVPWIVKAPTVPEMLAVATIVKDEVRHARVMYRLLADLGINPEEKIRQTDLTLRVSGDQDLGTARAATDKRVNIFYYPIDTWADFVMFNFCMDRGAGHQLLDVYQCSYGPWRRVIDGIFKEEKMHIAHGETWIKRLAGDPATHEDCQQGLNRWYIRTMNIFGRPNSPRNKIYRELRLKIRDNDEVRRAFAQEVKEIAEPLGLSLPTWKPKWEELPQEAFIPG